IKLNKFSQVLTIFAGGVTKIFNLDSKQLDETNQNTYDFDLMAQELANTGSSHSRKQLLHLIDTFLYSKCYEWVFILALVLKKFSVVNEVLRLVKNPDVSPLISNSIKKGIKELDVWSQQECCGYRSIIQKINNL
ncbi:unnamed protein product, partial [Brachionus calyciflorus]